MRIQRLISLAGSTLIVISCSVLSVSTLVFVKSVRANNGPPVTKTCTANTNSACATCTSTSQVYQCKPAALPTNCIYGTCPNTGSGPCGGCAGQTCGTTDWNCETPSASIDNSFACENQSCDTCKTAQ